MPLLQIFDTIRINTLKQVPIQQEQDPTWIITGCFAISVLLFIAWAYFKVKKEKKPIGEIFNVMMVHQRESFFVGLTLLLYFGESALAASVHPDGESLPNPLARFAVHLGISLSGMVAGLAFVRDLAAVFEKDLDNVSRYSRIFSAFIICSLTFAVPLGNSFLIAFGLGKVMEYYLFVLDWGFPLCLFVDDAKVAMKAIDNGLSYVEMDMATGVTTVVRYNTLVGIGYTLAAALFATFVHVCYTVYEGLQNLTSAARRKVLFSNPHWTEEDYKKAEEAAKKKEEEKKKKEEDDKKREERAENKEPAPTPGEARHESKAEENISFLLKRFGYADDELDRSVKIANKNLYEAINKTNKHDSIQITTRIAELVNKCKELDVKAITDEYKAEQKEADKEKVDVSIRKLFEGSTSAKNMKAKYGDKDYVKHMGLGLTIKGERGKPKN